MTDLSAELAPFLATLADAAAVETLPRFRRGVAVDNKKAGGFDPVTEADKMSEKAIRTLIAERFPDHGILGEEWGEAKGASAWRWVIDPVDGTRAFICGVPFWTTLIGAEKNGVPMAGVIDQPFMAERWIGVIGSGTTYWRHGASQRCAVSGCTKLSDARIMVTDLRAEGAYLSIPEAELVHRLARSCKVLRQGLDAYAFGLVAMGEMDLVIEAGLSWYDICAVIPVIEAAGGVAMTWDGAPIRETSGRLRVILAASDALAEAAMAMLAM